MKARSARLQTCLLRRFALKGQGHRLRRADLFNFKAQRAQSRLKPHSPRHGGRAPKTRRIRHAHPRPVIHKPGAYGGHNLRRNASQWFCQQEVGLYQHTRTGAQGAKPPKKSIAKEPGTPEIPLTPVSPVSRSNGSRAEEYVLLSADKVRTAQGQEYVKLSLSLDGKHYTVWGRDSALAALEIGTILKTELKQNKGAYFLDSYEVTEEAVA